MVLVVKNLPANAEDTRDIGLIPGLGRSTGRRHGNLLQYFLLENPMDRGAWQVIVHGVWGHKVGDDLAAAADYKETKYKTSEYTSALGIKGAKSILHKIKSVIKKTLRIPPEHRA